MDLHPQSPVHLAGSVPKTCQGWVEPGTAPRVSWKPFPRPRLSSGRAFLKLITQLNTPLSWLRRSWQARLSLIVTSSEKSPSGTRHPCKEWQQPRLSLTFVPRTSEDSGRGGDVALEKAARPAGVSCYSVWVSAPAPQGSESAPGACQWILSAC